MDHLAIEEQQSGESLILCRTAHPALDRQVREKCRNLRLSQLGGMTSLVKLDETTDPPHILLLGPAAVVAQPNRRPYLGEQFHPAMLRRTSRKAGTEPTQPLYKTARDYATLRAVPSSGTAIVPTVAVLFVTSRRW